ncbi:MAG: hypothetical protein C4K49_02095 [Candidatus Thorarchaeota archaeon]|nr:MAG: hypothetical protein C4K49_02095 [Candidatus Thorarchaeota archaeon]
MDARDVILHLFENERLRRVLIQLYEGKKSFTALRGEARVGSNATLSRDLEFLDSAGLIVNIFQRTDEGSYSYYELNSYGKRVAQIVLELERTLDKKLGETLVAQ